MSEKKFSKKHEWVIVDGDVATIGITKHATEMLGDIVFVEVPEKGSQAKSAEKAVVAGSINTLESIECCIIPDKSQVALAPDAPIVTVGIVS